MSLSLDGLAVRLGGRDVLGPLDLTLQPGTLVGLIGPNGAGKSTLLKAIAGVLQHTGEVRLDGAPVQNLEPRTRARQIAYLPQDREIAWPMAVSDLVALGRQPHRPPFHALGPADAAAITAALVAMDLEALANRSAQALSGGEQARVLLARVLAQDAMYLLADEPSAGLDPAHQIDLMERFRTLSRAGRMVLVSLHDLPTAARWCDRLVLVDQGRIVADGPPETVLTPQHLAAVYGIAARIEPGADGLLVMPTGRVDGPPRPEPTRSRGG